MDYKLEMRVIKRNGNLEEMSFDKILNRIKKLGTEVGIQLNYQSLAMKVIDQLYDQISTTKIDELAAEQCAMMSITHPDFATLAGRIVVSNHQKNTDASFVTVLEQLHQFKDDSGNLYPLVSSSLMTFVKKYSRELEDAIDHSRDYLIDYFGFKTLEKSYLFKLNGTIVERPQHMWMRVAIGIHGGDDNDETSLQCVKETYDLMSQKYFTHATPTLFNAGTNTPQLSSCYLLAMEDDSIEGIYNTLKDCALISKYSGGIGLHIHNIRAKNSHIRGTNGKTDGLVPMLRVYNHTARYVNQSGKRNGSFAIYIEPWHADVEDFLELRKNHGDEDSKARDLFYALWVPDLFMERVKNNENWSLMCPHECMGLSDVYGDQFVSLYTTYESQGKVRKSVSARSLWFKILDAQMETGTPYILYKDACNAKSNQKNIGTIKSSNLCTEIIQYSDNKETSVCNLASLGLPTFVNTETKQFDYEKLHQITKVVTSNLNKIIDVNFYPTEKTMRSNMRHRPIGIGVQGLADVFVLMDIPFHSDAAKEINKLIFETIYHAALERSNEIAKYRSESMTCSEKNNVAQRRKDTIINHYEENNIKSDYCSGSYSSFKDSPASKGILQFDMWGVTPSDRYEWDSLKQSIQQYGLRNSLLVAPMPTASTSQILGFNECFEPFTSNLYSRRTLAGEFIVINKYLVRELIGLGVWNEDIKNNIIANKGSIQQLTQLSQHIRDKYKIVWEIPMKHVIDMAADRGAFICQSQSMNLWVEDPNYNILSSMHFYSWQKGLKTGIYYLRRKAKHQAQQFTLQPVEKTDEKEQKQEKDEEKEKGQEKKQEKEQEKYRDDEICESCSA